jgi:hypothetical protein
MGSLSLTSTELFWANLVRGETHNWPAKRI